MWRRQGSLPQEVPWLPTGRREALPASTGGVDDYSKAGSASEYGLFTNSAFAVYPDGGSPVPVDFSLNSMSYDTILLGSEIAGGGFGAGNAYSGEVIGWHLWTRPPQ